MNEPSTPEGIPVAQPVPLSEVESITYAGAPPRPAPVALADRVVTIDVLRGAAVLGILLVNIRSFAFTLADFETVTWATQQGWDAVALFFTRFFAQSKFITIFSLLFGMGLALQSERAAAKGALFVGMYSRRPIILLVAGLLHGILIWYGDVLSLYAAIGFIAMACRNVRSSRLLITAAILFVVPIIVILGLAAIGGADSFMQMPDWNAKAAAAPPGPQQEFFSLLGNEREIYQSGSYGEITALRSVHYFFFVMLFAYPMIIAWRCLALFLVGIVLIRKGILSRPDEHKRTLKHLVIGGFAVGLPLQFFENAVLYHENAGDVMATLQLIADYVGTAGMSFAYIGIVALICLRVRRSRILHAFSCVGRMALTNYLMQSIICTTLFYGYGLGLFEKLSHAQALAVVFAIFGVQLIISPIWLRYFRYGPFEWLWRTMTYMRVQPIRAGREAEHASPSSGLPSA